MAKKKADKPLTQLEKDYIKLYLGDLQRTRGRINPPDFDLLAEKMGRSVESIIRFAGQQPEIIEPEPETPKAEKPKLTHLQETLRKTIINPTAAGKGTVAVMSDGASTMIAEQQKSNPNPKSKYDKNIYRGNK